MTTVKPELARLLGEIGLMAAGYGLNAHAQAILAAVQDLSPGSAAPALGTALLLMNAGRNQEAADLLERALEHVAERDRPAATAFYGWALQRAGRGRQSEQVLQTLLAATPDLDQPAAGLAAALLNDDGSQRR